MAATAVVFSTAELLEMILICLPMKYLLFAQGVCRHWKATIDGTQSLQTALFFQPATTEAAFFHGSLIFCTGPECAYEARHCWFFSDNFFQELERASFLCSRVSTAVTTAYDFEVLTSYTEDRTHWESGQAVLGYWNRLEQLECQLSNNITKTRVFLNPLLVEKFSWFRSLFGLNSRDASGRSTFARVHKYEDLQPSERRAEASWRRMLISQPPLTAIPKDTRLPYLWLDPNIIDDGEPIKMEHLWKDTHDKRVDEYIAEGYRRFHIWRH